MNPALLALLGARAQGGGGDSGPVVYIGSSTLPANAASYTFSAVPIGAASASRTVVFVLLSRIISATEPTLTGVTVNGSAVTPDVVSVWGDVVILHAAIPAGTTANVVATFSGAKNGCALLAYTVDGALTAGPSATSYSSQWTTTMTLTGVSPGLVFAANRHTFDEAVASTTWTGLDEWLNARYGDHSYASVGYGVIAAPGNHTVVATASSAGWFPQAAAVAYTIGT